MRVMLAVLFCQVVDLGQTVSYPTMIAAITGGGFSVWYGWHTTTYTIPKIQTDFKTELQAMREFYAKEAKDMREFYANEARLQRESHSTDTTRLIDALATLEVALKNG